MPPKLLEGVNTNSVEGIFQLAGNIMKLLFWLAGVAAVIIIIIAGIQYITSAGSPEQTARAKKTITNAVVGLILVIFAYAIVSFIVEQIT